MGTFAYLLNGTLEIVTAGRVAGPLSFLMTFGKMKAALPYSNIEVSGVIISDFNTFLPHLCYFGDSYK